MAENPDGDPLSADPQAERILLFRLDDELLAIRVAEVSGVVRCESLRELPGAPPFVLGLAEWRGSVLTVLDLPGLLDRAGADEPACLIRLAPPLEQTALRLPASVQLSEHCLEPRSTRADEETEPVWCCGGESVRLLVTDELVSRVESEMRERS